MRASQSFPQLVQYSRPIGKLESRQPLNCRVWNKNSVSVQDDAVRSTHSLPEQLFKKERITAVPKRLLEDRHAARCCQVTHSTASATVNHIQCDDGHGTFQTSNRTEKPAIQTNSTGTNTTCPVVPTFVESKGQKYRLMQLPDFISLRDLAESQDGKWTTVHKDKQKTLLVESRPEDLKPGEKSTGLNIVRATVEWADIAPETLFNTLHDADYRKTWDKKMIDGYNICQLDPRNDIGYYSVQPHWLIAKRDFCNMRSWMEFTNGEYIIMNHSVCHPDCPEREGFVRARSILSGYYMLPAATGGVKLIFIAHSDPKGSVPAWLVNNLMGSLTPSVLTNLHDCASKYIAWALDNHGAAANYKWRTPKIDWNEMSKEDRDDVTMTKPTACP